MKSVLISAVLMGLISTGLCIKCYAGIGDVGSSAVSETDGHESCQTTTVSNAAGTAVTRSGLAVAANDGCSDTEVMGITTKTCICNTDLCNGQGNSAPATAQALLPILAMAMLVKFIM